MVKRFVTNQSIKKRHQRRKTKKLSKRWMSMTGIMLNKNAMNQQEATATFIMPTIVSAVVTKQRLQDSLVFI